MNQKFILVGASPTQKCIALLTLSVVEIMQRLLGCRSELTRQISRVVSNEQRQVTYNRIFQNDALHGLSVGSNKQGRIGFKHGRLRKTKGLKLRMGI